MIMLLNDYSLLSFVSESKTGDDTVILNEKSPVIMTKAADCIDLGNNPASNRSPDASGSKRRKGSKKPTDDKTLNLQQQSSNSVSTANPDTKILTQQPVKGKHLDNNDKNIDHSIKKISIDSDDDTCVDKNTEYTGDTVRKPDKAGKPRTEIEPKVDQPGADVDEEDNVYYNTVGKRVPLSELADYVNAKSYEYIENEFEVRYLNRVTRNIIIIGVPDQVRHKQK